MVLTMYSFNGVETGSGHSTALGSSRAVALEIGFESWEDGLIRNILHVLPSKEDLVFITIAMEKVCKAETS